MVRFISADMGILKILRKKVCFFSLSKTTEIMGFCVDSVYLPHMGFRFFCYHHLEIESSDMVKNPLDMIMIIMYILLNCLLF
jgi:hypothetical protein